MLLKLLGCALIVGSSTLMGFSVAAKYSKRPGELRTLQAALNMLESEIAFSLNSLPDAFDKISRHIPENIGQIFAESSSLIRQRTGITAREAWSFAVEKAWESMHLEKQDKEILITFGNSLGRSDRENQLKNIHLACSKLVLEEKKAEEQKQKYEKLYKSLGVLGGLLIALLLI